MTPDELQLLCRQFRQAMHDENITGFYQERVMNRVLYGDPAGFRHEPDLDETVSFRGPMYPPGRTAAGGWVLTDEEAAEVLRASEARDQAVYNAVHPFPVEPHPDAPVFGSDFREVTPEQMDDKEHHPLLSACRCGNQILRHVPEESSWEHC